MSCCFSESSVADRELVTLSELKKENLILRLPNSGTRNLFVAHLESNNMDINEFNVILELDNVATIKDLIRSRFRCFQFCRKALVKAGFNLTHLAG